MQALVDAADLYDEGVAAGEFASQGRPEQTSDARRFTQADLGVDFRPISDGRRLGRTGAVEYIGEHRFSGGSTGVRTGRANAVFPGTLEHRRKQAPNGFGKPQSRCFNGFPVLPVYAA